MLTFELLVRSEEFDTSCDTEDKRVLREAVTSAVYVSELVDKGRWSCHAGDTIILSLKLTCWPCSPPSGGGVVVGGLQVLHSFLTRRHGLILISRSLGISHTFLTLHLLTSFLPHTPITFPHTHTSSLPRTSHVRTKTLPHTSTCRLSHTPPHPHFLPQQPSPSHTSSPTHRSPPFVRVFNKRKSESILILSSKEIIFRDNGAGDLALSPELVHKGCDSLPTMLSSWPP